MNKYINQDRAVKILKRTLDHCSNDDMAFALNWAIETLKRIPAADVKEVRHGVWLENGANYKCSQCGNTESYYSDSYCRVCGAKME